jgi:hypothetical protein
VGVFEVNMKVPGTEWLGVRDNAVDLYSGGS